MHIPPPEPPLPLDSCEHDWKMREGALVLGRRVVAALAAALCLSLGVGVLGAPTVGAAPQSKSGVTVTVAVSPPTEVYGVINQVFSVTIAPPATTDVSPTGVVTVSDQQVDLCPPISLPAPGVGPVTVISADSTVAIPVNPSTIAEYSYSGDQNYLTTKGRVSGAVTAADTTTSVTASSAAGTWGSEQSLVFSATVEDSQSGSVGVPTGEVSVEQGPNVICTMTLSNGSGTCSPAATTISPGTYAITASYGGDTNFNPSPLSAPATLAISPASLLVTGNDQAMPYGSALPMMDSTISGFVDGQSLATSGVTGQADCTTTATIASPVGTYPITCTAGSLVSSDYAFDFAPGTLTVSRAPAAMSLQSLAATVSAKFSGTPTGSVTFLVAGDNYSCTLSPQTPGSASCAVNAGPNIAPGTYPVRARYSGDANFTGSFSIGQLAVLTTTAPAPGTGTGTNPTNVSTLGTEGGTLNTVTQASLESSAKTNAEVASINQQIVADGLEKLYLQKYIAGLLQNQGAAGANGSSEGRGTSGPLSSQGPKSADGPIGQAQATGGSGASSGNRVNASLVVSKSGLLVPILILAGVLVFSAATAIEVRRRTRRAAGVPASDNDAHAVTAGD